MTTHDKLFVVGCIAFLVVTIYVIATAQPNHTFTPFFEMLNGK